MVRRLAFVGIAIIVCSSVLCADLHVGVYMDSVGADGLQQALQDVPGITVHQLHSLDLAQLVACDVVAVSSLKGLGGGHEDWRKAIRTYAAIGGGIVLEHDSVGCKGWTDQTRLFPEVIAVGIDRSSTQTVQPAADHAVTAGLPASFEHAYADHIIMQVGHAGRTVVTDADGMAAVIVGEHGRGRVVANGMISGYGTDEAGAQGEMAPTDAPLSLLLNSLRWAGEGGIAALDRGELTTRLAASLSQELAGTPPPPTPYTDWYPGTAVREGGFLKQPIDQLGGRSFMWWDVRSGYPSTMMHAAVVNMKRLGVTDIIYLGQSGTQLGWPSDVPGATRKFWLKRYGDHDPLKTAVEAARAEGLRIWLGMHSGDYGEGMVAVDQHGKPYMYGTHPIDDTRSETLRGFLRSVLVEAKERYDIAGIYYDELFFDYVDMHGDDFDHFTEWCLWRFGEKPSNDLLEKLAQGRSWVDPDDVWWRRMVLYKAWCNTDFTRFLAETAHELGMQAIGELRPSARYANGWMFGMDTPSLVEAGCDIYYVAPDCEAAMVYPTACCGQHQGRSLGFYNTYNLRGKPTFNFVYSNVEIPFAYGCPEQPQRMRELLRDCREWDGASSLARACVLTYQMGLMLQNLDPRAEDQAERYLLKQLGRYQDVDRMEVQETEFYANYRVLLAPPRSVQGLDADVFDAMLAYVSAGGTVISLGGPWVQSLPDFTDQVDRTEECLGGVYDETSHLVDALSIGEDQRIKLAPQDAFVFIPSDDTEVLAAFPDGTPAVTINSIGQGQIVALHCDVPTEVNATGTELEQYLASLIARYSAPEITVLDRWSRDKDQPAQEQLGGRLTLRGATAGPGQCQCRCGPPWPPGRGLPSAALRAFTRTHHTHRHVEPHTMDRRAAPRGSATHDPRGRHRRL